MAIAPWCCYEYHTVLHADRADHWAGVADEDGSPSLLGRRPSVIVSNGHVTITRRSDEIRERGQASCASFDGGEALSVVLRQGDRLACWRDGTGEIGLSVSRAGSLVLGLGTLGHHAGSGITIDHDPRVEETEFARDIRYIDRAGTHIVWLDPDRPSELEARLRELDGTLSGVKIVAIVARTNDEAVRHELNRRTMGLHVAHRRTTVFLNAPERFSSVDDWLAYGRTLSTQRPADLWLRVRRGGHECLVPEGTTANVDGWLMHVLRVYEPGEPGQLSQLGVVAAEAGVTPAMLESSTRGIAQGLTFD